MRRRGRDAIAPKSPPSRATHNQESGGSQELATHGHQYRTSPEEWGICASNQAPQSLGPAPERQAPKTSGFESQQSLYSEETGLYRTEMLLLRMLMADSFIPGPSTKAVDWKAPRPHVKKIHLPALRHLPEGHKPAGTLSRDGGTGGSHF